MDNAKITLTAFLNRSRYVLKSAYIPLAILIIINLMVGASTINDYGESVDEKFLYIYSEDTLRFYARPLDVLTTDNYGPSNHRYYGPFYLIAGNLLQSTVGGLFTGWLQIDAWHFANFVFYQLGLILFYFLCRRFMSASTAFIATLLFSTQPLFWGHAFMNPKDIPFMVMFIGSTLFGIKIAENHSAGLWDYRAHLQEIARRITNGLEMVKNDWRHTTARDKRPLIFFIILLVIALIFWSVGTLIVPGIVEALYSAAPGSALAAIFSRFASNASQPVDAYINKGLVLYNRTMLLAAIASLLAIAMAAAFTLPETRASLQNSLAAFARRLGVAFRSKEVWFAGIFLGLTTAIRVPGLFAGLLVIGYLIIKRVSGWLPISTAYFSIAAITTYLSWPFLWEAPVSRFLTSFTIMADFPFDGKVLFNGVEHLVDNLPASYFPALVSLQLTEPVLLLFLAGVVAALIKTKKDKGLSQLLVLAGAWLFIPAILIVLAAPVLYNNFRQLFFIIPPVFVFAGIGIEAVRRWSKKQTLTVLLTAVLIFPGIKAMLDFHPYEYTYYNSLVDQFGGVSRNFEGDYWGLAAREAANYVNENAGEGARVYIWRFGQIAENFLRSDLELVSTNAEPANPCSVDYALLTTQHSKDIYLFADYPIIKTIYADEIPLMVIKKIEPC